jgi:hypothetical protein
MLVSKDYEGGPLMKPVACVLVFVLAAFRAGAGSGQQSEEPRRHQEQAGGFSFIPPKDWEVRDFPGLKYKIVTAPLKAGFTSNINVVEEQSKGALEDYVKANITALEKVFKKCKIISHQPFKTESGLESARVVAEAEQGEKMLRYVFYFFSRDDTKFVVTCTTLADGGEKLDPVLDSSLKSFRFEGK